MLSKICNNMRNECNCSFEVDHVLKTMVKVDRLIYWESSVILKENFLLVLNKLIGC